MSNATKETVIVLDFGGQYNQLIARRVRECNVYCEILPYTVDIQKIKDISPKGIIFTGGPNSVYDESSPHYTPEIFELGIPILGICYGCQLMPGSSISSRMLPLIRSTQISWDFLCPTPV